MKKLLLVISALLVSQIMMAQGLKFGPRVAISSNSIKASDLVVTSSAAAQDLKLSLQEGNSKLQLGVFARLELLGLYVQPELLFSTNKIQYAWEDAVNGSTTRTEKYTQLDIPVIAGIKIGPIRVQGGPVYQMNFGSASDLVDVDNFMREFETADLDIRAGVGVDIGPLIIDVTYQIPMGDTKDILVVDGINYEINTQKAHLVGSVGFAF